MNSKAARMLAAVATMIPLVSVGPMLRVRGHIALGQGARIYRVIDLGTLGGTVSTGNTINDRGWAMGASNEAGNAVQLATLWVGGLQIPLGTLGGPSSDIAWPVKNNFGLISGETENGVPDPLGETFLLLRVRIFERKFLHRVRVARWRYDSTSRAWRQ